MQSMMDDRRSFDDANSYVLSMVIGGKLECAMWQLQWWGLRIEMLLDRAR
jgi:hypothetical protein